MASSDKRKQFLELFGQVLEPLDFHPYKGKLWRFCPEGKFAISIELDLTRFGTLNEIFISFGSYFAPIEIDRWEEISRQNLGLPPKPNKGPFKIQLSTTGLGFCRYLLRQYKYSLFNVHGTNVQSIFDQELQLTFEKFKEIVVPLFVGINTIEDYVKLAEVLMDWKGYCYYNQHNGTTLELALIYYYLNSKEDAYRICDNWRELSEKRIQFYQDPTLNMHPEALKSARAEWHAERDAAIQMKKDIACDAPYLHAKIEANLKQSEELCTKFFRRLKKKA